eukprot:CAMPEP_0184373268 /NCGR_PEP_ID=MMETSP1089-20130417/164408_1 /TAXON_ID=38269 ORGANISM="Gloeochaete wittrockiana, Strain SAG46.84" /NCGR_SAMPLE_ID=MMETSP1089 /ASSEMBLY_ACC=CAM_ASM_000445 /LENGTH=35 /DNA_ID= /DNA_START= /DNA_END= /DNA_ORIENTATION=
MTSPLSLLAEPFKGRGLEDVNEDGGFALEPSLIFK